MAFAGLGSAGVFFVIGVSTGTMRLASLFVVLTFGVLAGCHDFHVIGIAADPISAKVVKLQAFWDLLVLVVLPYGAVDGFLSVAWASLPFSVPVGGLVA